MPLKVGKNEELLPEKATGSSELLQSEIFDFELIVSNRILELECVEEVALSLSDTFSTI